MNQQIVDLRQPSIVKALARAEDGQCLLIAEAPAGATIEVIEDHLFITTASKEGFSVSIGEGE